MTIAAPEGAAATGSSRRQLSVGGERADRARLRQPGSRHPAQRRDLRPRIPPTTPTSKPCSRASSSRAGRDAVPRAAAAGRDVLLPLRGAPDHDDRDHRVRRRRGEGGGGRRRRRRSTVVAKALAFDTDEIDLPAGQPTHPHVRQRGRRRPAQHRDLQRRLAVRDACSRASSSPGSRPRTMQIPALERGTYYFHCDVHPTMNGTVVGRSRRRARAANRRRRPRAPSGPSG